ncbi:MAG: hypothetical protein R3F43_30350 [bacterium]
MTRATAVVWLGVAVHAGLVIHRAWDELTDAYVVQGLFRTYRPPGPQPDGWLVDPRPGDLATEITARYGPASPASAPAPSPTAWAAWLAARGLSPRPATGFAGPDEPPRLIFLASGEIRLQTGRFQGQAVLFDPPAG